MNPVDEDRALSGQFDEEMGGGRRVQTDDSTTRLLIRIALLIGVVLLVLVVGWMLLGRQDRQVPVIEAQAGPVRVRPVDPGGMQALGAQSPVVGSPDGSASLAPPPEQARPEALQAQLDAARQGGAQGEPVPAAPLTSPAPAPVTAPRGAPLPAQTGAPSPMPAPPSSLHTDATREKADPEQADPEQADPQQAGAPVGVGSVAVQLAALGSHQAAQSEWVRLCRVHPSLFSGRRASVQEADLAGRQVWRLRTHGFTSLAAAHSFCVAAWAQKVACTVANF